MACAGKLEYPEKTHDVRQTYHWLTLLHEYSGTSIEPTISKVNGAYLTIVPRNPSLLCRHIYMAPASSK
jgi:hypothetical protein